MIEITRGTAEEQIIKILQKRYPLTVEDITSEIHLSKAIIQRVLQQLQVKGIVQLEPLPDKTFIRLLRNDFKFVGKKRQKKFIKHHSTKKKYIPPNDSDDIMYS
jgi:predicted transcriptional regulator